MTVQEHVDRGVQATSRTNVQPEPGFKKYVIGLAAVIGAVVTYYLIQYLTGVLAVYPHLGLSGDLLQRGNWVQMMDHHLWQMILALALIGLLSRGNFRAWGLNLDNWRESLRIIKKFVLYFGVYFAGIGAVLQWFSTTEADQIAFLGHSLNATNITGNLAFRGLLSGLSEEILFRGLIHTFLAQYFVGVWRWRGTEIPVAGIIATVIFTLVHINFRLDPFEITHLYVPQLILAFVLGLYYSIVYHRTGSLLNPILAHNFSNAALYISSLVLIWLM
jgi:membrane protease YdiL (CAAX protease family)